MNRLHALIAALLTTLVFGTGSASASEGGLPWHRRPNAAVRVIGAGYPDMLGTSASVYFPRPLTLEAGISRGSGNSGSWYARTGPAISLRESRSAAEAALDDRSDERYPTYDVLVEPMVGYRAYETSKNGEHETFGGPTLATAVDVMVWVNPKTAIDFQVSMGGDYWLQKSDPDVIAFTPDLRLGAGFAF